MYFFESNHMLTKLNAVAKASAKGVCGVGTSSEGRRWAKSVGAWTTKL